eukprot:4297870-Pleurochrysis_carterae.AAC.1
MSHSGRIASMRSASSSANAPARAARSVVAVPISAPRVSSGSCGSPAPPLFVGGRAGSWACGPPKTRHAPF